MSEVERASLAQSGKTEENEAQVRSTIHAIGYAYSGPLPPPQVLREFEQILPGAAERIFIQFEAQAEHRRRSETKVIDSNTLSQKLGAISAPVIGLSGVVGGMILVGRGFNITGLGPYLRRSAASWQRSYTSATLKTESGLPNVPAI